MAGVRKGRSGVCRGAVQVLLAEGHRCRAVQSPIPSSGCPGLLGERVTVEGTDTSLFPARLSQGPLLQRARPVLTQHLAAAGSAGSPGRALPD